MLKDRRESCPSFVVMCHSFISGHILMVGLLLLGTHTVGSALHVAQARPTMVNYLFSVNQQTEEGFSSTVHTYLSDAIYVHGNG